MDRDSSTDEGWPPPDARLRSIVWRAEEHLERGEFVAAALTLEEGFGLGQEELLRGLHHLAAAGYRAQTGDTRRARRQLAHARRRLASHPGAATLVSSVGQVVESPRGEGELA
jgi:hypothetical protein